jgi:hypothetical protein
VEDAEFRQDEEKKGGAKQAGDAGSKGGVIDTVNLVDKYAKDN